MDILYVAIGLVVGVAGVLVSIKLMGNSALAKRGWKRSSSKTLP